MSNTRPGAALSPLPRACALQGCRIGAATGPPTHCRHQPHGVAAPQRAKRFTLRVCIFPFHPHRRYHQPGLWPFPFPPRTRCPVLLATALGPGRAQPCHIPLGQPGSPWGCPGYGSAPVLAALLPSLSPGFNNISLAQYGKQLQQPQGRLSRQGHRGAAVEGLPLSCRVGGGLAILCTPTTPGVSPATQTPHSRHKPISY